MLREWAYGRLYASSAERLAQLRPWLERYNYRRKHGSLHLGRFELDRRDVAERLVQAVDTNRHERLPSSLLLTMEFAAQAAMPPTRQFRSLASIRR
jgi:hypothetical protein